MTSSKKQAPGKKKYVKKSSYWDRLKNNQKTEEPVLLVEPEKDQNEIVDLFAICEVFNRWGKEQRRRNFQFLMSKYREDFNF